MIFYKGEVKSIQRVLEALDHFSQTTELMANVEKTNIFLAGITEEV